MESVLFTLQIVYKYDRIRFVKIAFLVKMTNSSEENLRNESVPYFQSLKHRIY